MVSWRVILAVGLLGSGSGCASAPVGPRAPAEVVRAQVRSLAVGDELAAATWLTPEARARAPLWPAPADVPADATVAEVGRSARWDDGDAVELVRGTDGWQIRRGVLGLSHADSPERALVAFGRALVAADWSMVMELVPSEVKAAWSVDKLGAELARGPRAARWRALGEALAAERWVVKERDPDRARAQVTLGAEPTEVVVVREGSGWKVFDVAPRSGYIAP